MMEPTRREMLAASLAAVMAPVHGVAAATKPVRIRDVDIFNIKIPATSAEIAAGVYDKYSVVEISTDAGVTGYSFAGPSPTSPLPPRRPLAGRQRGSFLPGSDFTTVAGPGSRLPRASEYACPSQRNEHHASRHRR